MEFSWKEVFVGVLVTFEVLGILYQYQNDIDFWSHAFGMVFAVGPASAGMGGLLFKQDRKLNTSVMTSSVVGVVLISTLLTTSVHTDPQIAYPSHVLQLGGPNIPLRVTPELPVTGCPTVVCRVQNKEKLPSGWEFDPKDGSIVATETNTGGVWTGAIKCWCRWRKDKLNDMPLGVSRTTISIMHLPKHSVGGQKLQQVSEQPKSRSTTAPPKHIALWSLGGILTLVAIVIHHRAALEEQRLALSKM
eukprot:TRINITY_DN3957_c0_g1_i1.p1 TRINITY_DN3957_c0_g1~~TRINITY_DN3957_c0_g1_i1.p1  ORF type:complete len:247 (-),score=22.41 TRINITY_DN3957_c0_g1_i1:192-932(-)